MRHSELSLSKIYQHHHAALTRFVRRLMRKPLERRVRASDVVQEVMVDCSKHWSTCCARLQTTSERLLSATTFAWLRKIARCKIADINRRDRGDKRSVAREVGLTDQHDDQFSLMALDKSPSDRVIEKEELKLTLEAIEKLDSREQKIVSMKYQLQMTNTEIADHYGMTASDLGVKLFRILAKIRKQLGAESDGIKR